MQCPWWDLIPGPLTLQATALPTELNESSTNAVSRVSYEPTMIPIICERSELFMVKNVYLGFSSHGFTYWWIYIFSAHCKHVPWNTLTHSTNEDFLNIKRKGDAKSQTLSRTCTSDITETGNPCVIKVILLACSTDIDIFKFY
jgi:hypothetical protein